MLLHLLEFVLGNIDSWPTTILNRLFVDAPALSNIKTNDIFLRERNTVLRSLLLLQSLTIA
jgi:hypothetical protein